MGILSFNEKSWGQIIVLHQLSFFTPEAERMLRETMAKRKQHGLQASAVVINQGEGRSLMMEQLSRCYRALDIKLAFFDSIDEGRTWLKSTI